MNMNNYHFYGSSMNNYHFYGSSMNNYHFYGSSMNNDHFHGSSMNKVLIITKNINENNYSWMNHENGHYIEVGIDVNIPVLYVYKDGELFDWHFFGSTYVQEMKNLINCYTIVHGHEPSIQMINEFRCWCKTLKDKNIIA